MGVINWHGATVGPGMDGQPGPDAVLSMLLEGNRRFAAGEPLHPHQDLAFRSMVAGGQKPLATVITCVDSRCTPEFIFDQGLGDMFVLRVAGNIITPELLASIEFGIEAFQIPLIVLLGHQRCGAVAAAVDSIRTGATPPGHIGVLVDALRPAILSANKGGIPRRSNELDTPDSQDLCGRANVVEGVQQLRKAEPIVSESIAMGKVAAVGMYYSLETGLVERVV